MLDLNTHYALLLGLDSNWIVTDVDLQLDGRRIELRLTESDDASFNCAECGEACSLKDHAAQRSWRHLDTMQFETVIFARVPRTRCRVCGTKNVEIPWAEPLGRFTLLFEAFAIQVLQKAASFKAAAELLRLDWDAVQAIADRAVERGLLRRETDATTKVGIDELLPTTPDFLKGQHYISVMTDLTGHPEGNRVLDVVEGRDTTSARALFEKALGLKRCGQITAIAMDMSQSYVNAAAECCPDAWVVHDRFHVMKLINEAVDQVRRAEHKQLKKEGSNHLTGTKYQWLKNPENMNEKQAEHFAELKKRKCKTARAWEIKEMFREMYEAPNPHIAFDIYTRWHSWAIRCRIKPIVKVAKTIRKRWLNVVLFYHMHPISNGPAEGFNSMIQSAKSAARGFRSFMNYRTRVLFKCGRLDMVPERARALMAA